MKSAVRRAEQIVVVSESTRLDVNALVPESQNRLTVVPNGVADLFQPADSGEIEPYLRACGLPTRYILTVGNRKPHKNLAVAARVIEELHAREPHLIWVIVGTRFHDDDPVDRVKTKLGDAIVLREDVRDDELRMLYAGATAVFLPSLWEGFGLPAAEAMACGAPVVASNISAFAEVVGEAGILCPPSDEVAFVNALQRIANQKELSTRLSQLGLTRAQSFSWDASAAILSGILRKVSEHSKASD
jgi:alpha-1,3-rhamnosyl/mannosyltransferase